MKPITRVRVISYYTIIIVYHAKNQKNVINTTHDANNTTTLLRVPYLCVCVLVLKLISAILFRQRRRRIFSHVLALDLLELSE